MHTWPEPASRSPASYLYWLSFYLLLASYWLQNIVGTALPPESCWVWSSAPILPQWRNTPSCFLYAFHHRVCSFIWTLDMLCSSLCASQHCMRSSAFCLGSSIGSCNGPLHMYHKLPYFLSSWSQSAPTVCTTNIHQEKIDLSIELPVLHRVM